MTQTTSPSAFKLLWVDDEIELLTAHIIYLRTKGYEVDTATNGFTAMEMVERADYDLILLDENMPGISGLETLERIKQVRPQTPVVMVTKSEEEDIMNQAIGQQIADYLIKPGNQMQILLTLKKNIHRREIVTEVAQTAYRQQFGKLDMQIAEAQNIDDFKELFKRLIQWEQELTEADSDLLPTLEMQKTEANAAFAKFVRRSYQGWLATDDRPMLSTDVVKRRIFPLLDQGQKVTLVVVDNLRFDQWRTISQELSELFAVEEDLYCSILPTATQYARNAIFSGLMPLQIQKTYPHLWVDEEEEESKNQYEAELMQTQLDRHRRRHTMTYHKVNTSTEAERLVGQMRQLGQADINIVVLNFIDMLSHARTESRMVRELANNEAAYRSITLSWFRHPAVRDFFRALAHTDRTVKLTTDHGSIRCTQPIKVQGDRNTNTNLRYKLGKNLRYNPKEVWEVKRPADALLPSPNLSTSYIFASGPGFFAYPNNYNYYVTYYRNTFQHGGISMEEMLVPLVTLRSKKR